MRLNATKVGLIDEAFSKFKYNSFATLGDVWVVDGGYTFHTLEKHNISKAFLVDTHLNDTVRNRAQGFDELELIDGNFGEEKVRDKIGAVDAIILYDVLLHQVEPDWERVLEMYSSQTKCFLIYNQQWIDSPKTIRLLDMGEEEYFKNTPQLAYNEPYLGLFEKLDKKHPDYDNRNWRDVHHIWQWGITDEDLLEVMSSLGFKSQLQINCGPSQGLSKFEDHAFIFSKDH